MELECLNPEAGDTRMYSCASLNRKVHKFANVLKSLGVKKAVSCTEAGCVE